MTILLCLVAVALGALSLVLARARMTLANSAAVAHLELAALRERLAGEVSAREDLRERLAALQSDLTAERERHGAANSELAGLRESLKGSEEKLQLLQEARAAIATEFQALASEVVQKNGEQIAVQQQERLGLLLEPFKEHLAAFGKKVEETNQQRVVDQASARAQIKGLVTQSLRINESATDLTRALRGNNKAQGDWGEAVLARILEDSGFQEGREFMTQPTERTADGQLLRPDVVIKFPAGKNLVVDSKVSLLAWMNYCDSSAESDWQAVVASVRTHAKSLAEKNYPQLYGLSGVDFVLMFIPVEPVFLEVTRREPTIVREAYERNVMLVGPSTLLFALRTVNIAWAYERQNQNAQEIAARGGKLYGKFVSFVEELLTLGEQLHKATELHDASIKKLTTGRGNLMRQAHELAGLAAVPPNVSARRFQALLQSTSTIEEADFDLDCDASAEQAS